MTDPHLAAIDRELQTLQKLASAPRDPQLGCSTISHERLGYCGGCSEPGLEMNGWRLLALRDKAEDQQ